MSESKLCKCGEPMQPIYSQGETRYFCGVCQPEVDNPKTDKLEKEKCND